MVFSSSPDFPNVHPSFTTTALMIITILVQGYYKKIPPTRWFKQQTFIFYISGAWKSKIKVLADLVSGESCLLSATSQK